MLAARHGMQHLSHRSAGGFALLEAVVALAILVTVLAGIAQLFSLGLRLARASGSHGAALVFAQAKLEALRSLAMAYGPAGEMVTDPALAESPAGSLERNLAGYVDGVDTRGQSVAVDAGEAAFVRRWAIASIDNLEPQALAIEVCVFRAPADDIRLAAAEACLATIRSRQP